MNKPIAWTIAGSDSGGGAGIQADLHTFQQFGVHGCSVITATTAQNSHTVTDIHTVPAAHVAQQIAALHSDLPARALKLGMLGSPDSIIKISDFLREFTGSVICDPVCATTSGNTLLPNTSLSLLRQRILPYADILTPNLNEASLLLGTHITTPTQIVAAAVQLHQLGAKTVLIKGGHRPGMLSQDYWFNGQHGMWLHAPWVDTPHAHGSGCSLAAAITAAIALGHTALDAVIAAKAYVHQGLRLAQAYGAGPGPVAHAPWPCAPQDFPWLTSHAQHQRLTFARCNAPLNIYAIVENTDQLQRVLNAGITSVQLRIKQPSSDLPQTITTAITLAKQHEARLFINDHWQLALAHGAYGVHLGQDDLITADLPALAAAGLRLGISCHSYRELAIAHTYGPSYIGFGPIFATSSKALTYAPQGLAALRTWCHLAPYPIVAIGGIDWTNLATVKACGADGTALLSALRDTANLQQILADRQLSENYIPGT